MHSFLAGSGQQFTISLSKEKQFSVWGIEVNGRVKQFTISFSTGLNNRKRSPFFGGGNFCQKA
jgi:hypothetical protein